MPVETEDLKRIQNNLLHKNDYFGHISWGKL